MRILLVQNMIYVPVRGGGNKANRILMEGLAKRNHFCRVVVPATSVYGPRTKAAFLDELKARKMEFSASSDVTVFQCSGVEIHAVTENTRLHVYAVRQLREFDPSVILVSSQDPGYILLESILDEGNNKVVYLVHSPWDLPFGIGRVNNSPHKAKLIRQTTGIITVSKDLQKRIRQGCGCESTVIPFPIYGSGPFPSIGCFDKGFVTFVNPCAYKGISIFEALTRRLPNIQFAAVPTWGTTDRDRALLEQLDNVKVLDPVDNINYIFAQAKILLVPSLWPEGYPLIVGEAMLRGIPVLASDSGGLPEAMLGVDYVLPVQHITRYEERLDDMRLPIPVVPEQNIGPWEEELNGLVSDRGHWEQLSAASRQAALEFVSNLGIAPFENFLKNIEQIPKADSKSMHDPTKDCKLKRNELLTLINHLSPEKRALLALRLVRKGRWACKEQTIPQLPRNEGSNSFPLSFAQQRMWLFDQLEPGSNVYNMPLAIRFTGPLKAGILEQSLNEVIRRHENLRTTFAVVDGQPIQVIAPALNLSLLIVDLSSVPETEREIEVQQILTKEVQCPFDLTRGPLLRVKLLQLAEEGEYVFVLVIHHIISDGWSIKLLFRELTALYEALSVAKPAPLTELPIQYADFAVWQRQWLTGAVLETQLGYWKTQLGGRMPALMLPTDHPRPPIQTYKGARQHLELSKSLTKQINTLSRREGVTLFMTLLAAFKILLNRLTGQDDVIVGSPVANRNHSEIEGLIGFFVNTLVLRTHFSGNPTFRELLDRVKKMALEAYALQDLPFEKLVEELQPERDLSRSPLFQVFFNMLNFEREQLRLHKLKVENFPFSEPYSKFDLAVSAREQDQQIQLELIYNTDLFEDSTIAFILDHFKNLLENIVANPDQRISELRLLNRAKRLQLTSLSNIVSPKNPFVEFKRQDINQSIPQRFEQQAEKHPMNIAVRMGSNQWTYHMLNETANRAAKRILASCGNRGDRIGLLFEHGAQMIAGILAILKAGKVYVPLDPSLPAKRINYMLKDSQIATILTNNKNLTLAKSLCKDQIQTFNMDDIGVDPSKNENFNLTIKPDTIAYILYTSGSTGCPKGVMQTHRNVLGHIRNYTNNLRINNCDRLTLFSNYSFDAAMMDIMGALLNGATLCPMDIKEKSAIPLSEWLIKEEITVYHSTPTFYRYLISTLGEDEMFTKIRLVVLGGEEVYKKDVEMYKKHFSPECIIINTYGPTESTVVSQYFINNQTKVTRNAVPIGYPVDDTEILLLDKTGEVTEIFGEIAIRGAHIASGYWQKPELTRQAFVPDPDGGNDLIYRTGDMGRLLPDGSIEFKGRKDLQVKIRGCRVEPGETEFALSGHEAIKECAVATSDNGQGDNELIAYIVCDESVSSLSLRRYLRDTLPDYMIPSRFIQLDAIPLIHNGKIDYASLSLLKGSHAAKRPNHVPPISPIERKVADIWQNVLNVERISLNDNFFDLGGHSLMAVKAISLIEKELGIHMPFREFFNQTLSQFAVSCQEKLPSNKHDYVRKQ